MEPLCVGLGVWLAVSVAEIDSGTPPRTPSSNVSAATGSSIGPGAPRRLAPYTAVPPKIRSTTPATA
jgi:hypothetical protein